MKNRICRAVAASLALFLSTGATASAVQYVNDINCSLNDGVSLPDLIGFQHEWMAAARENGFDEGYRTAMVFPVYGDQLSLPPKDFIWRGYFKDGAQMGELNDFFFTSPEWGGRFVEIMTCEGSTLWAMP